MFITAVCFSRICAISLYFSRLQVWPKMAAASASPAMSWKALESNSEIFSTLIHELGAGSHSKFEDILGFEQELLAMVPSPCLAVVLLYADDKIKEAQQIEAKTTDSKAGEGKKQDSGSTTTTAAAKDLFFIEQIDVLNNACGTIAALHAVLNVESTNTSTSTSAGEAKAATAPTQTATPQFSIAPDSVLAKWAASARALSPHERGLSLAANKDIETVHNRLAGASVCVLCAFFFVFLFAHVLLLHRRRQQPRVERRRGVRCGAALRVFAAARRSRDGAGRHEARACGPWADQSAG